MNRAMLSRLAALETPTAVATMSIEALFADNDSELEQAEAELARLRAEGRDARIVRFIDCGGDSGDA